MDNTGSTPANADNTAASAATEVDAEVAQTGSESPADSAPESGAAPEPKRDKIQERFDTLTREKYAGLSRAELAEYKAQMLEQRLAELEARAKPETVAPSKPTLESCGWDESEFERRLLAYNNHQTQASTANVSEAVKTQLAAEREAERARETDREFERHEAEFIKSKPDYTEKVLEGAERRAWACSKEMAETIKELKGVGPEVLYYLADNPAKSVEIARLPAGLQRVEIGRIAGRLEAAKTAPPPVSKAPPPAPKLDGANATDDSIPNSSWSDERYDKWRQRQISQRG